MLICIHLLLTVLFVSLLRSGCVQFSEGPPPVGAVRPRYHELSLVRSQTISYIPGLLCLSRTLNSSKDSPIIVRDTTCNRSNLVTPDRL